MRRQKRDIESTGAVKADLTVKIEELNLTNETCGKALKAAIAKYVVGCAVIASIFMVTLLASYQDGILYSLLNACVFGSQWRNSVLLPFLKYEELFFEIDH